MTYNEFIQDILDNRGQWVIPECGIWENHHIIPLCMGGEPENYNHFTKHENMIWLAPHEHFIAHQLLYEENKDNYDLNCAYWRLANDGNHLVTPEEYEKAKIARATNMSDFMLDYYKDPKNIEAACIRNKAIRDAEKESGRTIGDKKKDYYKNNPEEYNKMCDNNSKARKKYLEEHPEAIENIGKTTSARWNTPGYKEEFHNRNAGKECYKKRSEAQLAAAKIAGEKRRGVPRKSTRKPVICIETGEIYDKVTDTGNPSKVSACCRGKRKKCLGYHWMYLEDYNKIKGTL